MHFFARKRSNWYVLGILAIGVLLVAGALPTRAVEVPPVGVLTYLQTNGPSNGINNGDWYTNNANGTAAGYHYLSFNVPCNWPAVFPPGPASANIYVDLFSPEMNSSIPASDEQTGGVYDNTMFELYGPGTTVTSPNIPGPGAAGSLGAQTVYTPVTAAAEQWVRFRTLAAPVTCGTYVLRAAVATNDQNAWRVRVGFDNDADPNNAPPANYDNPDGVAGTNDEITLGMAQTSYQHNQTVAANQCITLYQFVSFGQATVAFHNFDMDSNQRVRYYAPSATLDPTATTGGVAGTLSGDSAWNNGGTTTTRGPGDVINNPEPGWWRIVTCVGNNNQYIQEGQTGALSFYSQPPTPNVVLTKTDNRTTVWPGENLTYVLNYTNNSNGTAAPGAAINPVLTDTLPPGTSYVSCSISAPGTCSQSGGVVTFNFNQNINAGASGSVQVVVTVLAGAPNPLVNDASLTYQDTFSHLFPPATATDSDTFTPTSVSLASFGANQQGAGVRVTWMTGAEENTLGFHLLRSASADRAGASRITGALIPARGAGSSYGWTDTAVTANATYFYWLEEDEAGGATNEYGPVSVELGGVSNGQILYIPLSVR